MIIIIMIVIIIIILLIVIMIVKHAHPPVCVCFYVCLSVCTYLNEPLIVTCLISIKLFVLPHPRVLLLNHRAIYLLNLRPCLAFLFALCIITTNKQKKIVFRMMCLFYYLI